jgi:hypothetical protein
MLFVLFHATLGSLQLSAPLAQDPVDLAILQAFYSGTLGTDHWKQGCDTGCGVADPSNLNFCNWQGITCTDDQRNVKAININSCNLVVGKIPSDSTTPSIFRLKYLESVAIGIGPNYYLSGNIPDDFNTAKPPSAEIYLSDRPQIRWRTPSKHLQIYFASENRLSLSLERAARNPL